MEPSIGPEQTLVSGNQRWWVLLAIGISSFMSALDGSVVNITLPVISQYFKTDVAHVEWIVTIYLLVLSGMLLSFGRLGDMRGHKIIFMAGFFLFVLSSAICGLSSSVNMLITFRALQALGAAMISSNAPAILTKSFPSSQRGQALGMQATMTYLGLTVGPSLGGWLTSLFNWRAVFYINVPVGALALLVSARAIVNDPSKESKERFDLAGAVLFMAGLSFLLLGLNQGSEWGWGSLPILALLAIAVILISWFVWVEAKVTKPMLDLALFLRPIFSLSVISAILNYICVYTILFLMPFYLINGRGLDPSHAGLLLTAQPIVMAIVAPISGTLSDRIGERLPGVLGMAFLAVGMVLLSRLGPTSTVPQVAFALAVAGFGTGTFISPNNSALMGSAPANRQGIAAGTLATARNFGMVLGVGLAGAVYTTILASHGNPAGSASNSTLFLAFQTSFLAASIFGIIGMLTTAIRGHNNNGK